VHVGIAGSKTKIAPPLMTVETMDEEVSETADMSSALGAYGSAWDCLFAAADGVHSDRRYEPLVSMTGTPLLPSPTCRLDLDPAHRTCHFLCFCM
jgi:hypothetical protein